MFSRIVTTMTMVAGTALLCLPVQAQTGTSAQSTVNSGGASATGSVGTTSNTPRDNSSSSSTTMGPMGGGTTNSPATGSQGSGTGTSSQSSSAGAGSATAPPNAGSGVNMAPKYQAHAQAHARPSARMRGNNMAERQVTDCLNNAASQHQPLDSCKK